MMQPPPRTGPPPPPPPLGGIPNAFRRTWPHKQTGSSSAMLGPAQPVPPMTDPFAFGRQGTSGTPAGNHQPTFNSSHLPMQAPLPAASVSADPSPGQEAHPQEVAKGPPLAPFGLGANSLLPENVAASFVPPRQFSGPSNLAGSNAPGTEEGYLNTKEHGFYVPAGGLPQTQTALYQAQVMQPAVSPWISDHGSRPPSVQNYFQPTSDSSQLSSSFSSVCPPDPPLQAPPLQAPPPAPSPHKTQAAPSPYSQAQKQMYSAQPGLGGPQSSPTGPFLTENCKPEGNSAVTQQQNSQFQAHNYFGQNSTVPNPWFNQASREPFYHQMGGSSSDNRPSSSNDQQAPLSSPSGSMWCAADPGTISLFFKENDVENEETLTGEGKAVNGFSGGDAIGVGYGMNTLPPNPQMSLVPLQAGSEVSQRGDINMSADGNAQFAGESAALYVNDGRFVSGTQKQEGQFDHVENLECMPNQEVLPNEPQKMAQNISEHPVSGQANTAIHSGVHYEGGPNLETPDLAPRPVRPESVSSSYSNVSHGSASGTRRLQGMVGTFIQQEVAKPSEDSSAGYFEQIDTSPAGEGTQQHVSTKMSHGQLSQPVTPSPPKPTGIFQASANSSFEPVHAHSVGVRPLGIDQARMVAEKGGSGLLRMSVPNASPGNLEQPPDNLENIFMTSIQHPGAGVPEKRPCSRAHGSRLVCESPATTLWAQNELAIANANVVLAPAAPPAHELVKQPSAEVIQPPEDGPLDLQAVHHTPHLSQRPDNTSENLENPPKLSEPDPKVPQASLGYASLLVTSPATESFQNQPVLIAPPSTNCSLIPPNNCPAMVSNELPQNSGVDVRTKLLQQPSEVCAKTVPAGPPKSSNPLEHFASPVCPGNSGGRPAPNQSPLNLALESRQILKRDNPPAVSTGRPPDCCLPHADQLAGPSHPAPPVNSPALPVAENHKQPANFEFLDCTMSFSQSTAPNVCSVPSVVSQQALPAAPVLKPAVPLNNLAGFYRQVTKDTQQGGSGQNEPQSQRLADPGVPPGAAATNIQQAAPDSTHWSESRPHLNAGDAPANQTTQTPLQGNQYLQPPVPGQAPPGAFLPGAGGSEQTPYPPQPGNSSRPPSVLAGPPGYGGIPPVPAPMYGPYYGGAYPEYIDGRLPYPPPYPSCDPKAQPYYQDDPYRRYDPRYSRYEGSNVGYRDAERYQQREQPERPSSRTSQYSDRPSSRQGYPEDYQRASRSAYDEYYASYYKQAYDYGDRRWEHYDPLSTYDPRYRGYYDQSYWYNYDHKAYRSREMYYNQPYPNRREAYDDQWRYDPRYDASFDEQYACQRDLYRDDIDRHSVHSERSGHSLRSSRSHHSRRSSFSSRSQQSQVYRSQQDLVSAAYEPPGQAASIPVDYTYGQYPDNTDGGYQYPSAYPSEGGWSAVEQPAPRPVTPEKFVVPHCCARFGPSGQLIQVLPNLPSAGQPALVEIHSMEMMLQESEEQKELRSFPGPLVKDETHKVDVIKFAQDKSLACQRDDSLMDKDSAKLIWDFIVLLCRQNGTVVGTDIADLLLREHRSVWLPGKSPNEANLIDFTNEPLERPEDEPGLGPLSLLSDTFMTVPENPGKETERFRELLLFGRKKDALESAMKNGLWGHALLLASKMDNRTHARVMTRFANSLPINDPLQTVYQLMSGRMPAAATCCGDEKWGDWRPHLAMVLSNLTHALDLDMRTIATMGDTLASKGLIDAAHFCYMMAQVGLGVYTKKSTKMVLIGSNHSLPFFRFASNVAIQRTEAYEYALSLGSQPCSLPNFQVYKFLYACRLAEAGLCAQAFHYCEVISKAVLTMASYHSAMFISQLIQMSAKLRFFDPQLKEKPEQELFVEPDWLFQLRQLDGQIRDGVISYSTDRATPQQYVCSTPSSEFDQPTPPDHTGMSMDMTTNPDNTLMMSLLPSPGQPLPGVQLMPPAPPTILDEGMISVPPVPPAIESVQFYPAPPSHLYPTPGTIPPQQGPIHGAVLSMPSYTQAYPVSQPSSQISATVASPAPLEQQVPPQISSQPASPSRSTFTPHMDFYDQMANMASGKRSRTTSQSSLHTGQGLRSRTTSESSTHSMGRERSNSAAKPSLSNPEPIPEQPPHQDESKKSKKESPKKGSGSGWLGWFSRKGKTEAHLPDDKNKSIVWDSQKNRWVNTDEPEEENKPPPPPPSTFPKMAPQAGPGSQSGPPSGGPQVNIFSRKAGTRSRYVDVLNPGGASNKPAGSVPVPADLFAPLAPMPMPPNVFIPGAAPEEQQPLEGTIPEMTKEAVYPPSQDGAPVVDSTQAGELSRSSSMSSLSREVSQHLNQVPTQTPSQAGQPAGTVTFYNPSQFAQPSAPLGAAKQGRFGQRKYPALK